MTQPAASAAIAELESYYGVRLFDRIGRRLRLTEAGRHFLEYAVHILRLFDDLERIRDWDSLGVLRVGASITVGNCLLPGLIRRFRTEREQLRVEAVVDNSETVEEQVLRSELDLGLIEGSVHHPQIECQCFFRDRMVVIAPPNGIFDGRTEIGVGELREQPLLLRERGSAGREIVDGILAVYGEAVRPVWQSASTQAIVHAVGNGLGISLLPYLLVKEALEQGEVRQLSLRDVSLERRYLLIRHKDKYMTPAAQTFMNMVMQAA